MDWIGMAPCDLVRLAGRFTGEALRGKVRQAVDGQLGRERGE